MPNRRALFYGGSGSHRVGACCHGTDYITKDTPAALFWAKVETRIKIARSERTKLCFGPLILDLKKRLLLLNGEEVNLSPVEFDILWRLSKRPEHVYTPEEIFDMIWGGQLWDGGQMVQTHMSRLRRKLEKALQSTLTRQCRLFWKDLRKLPNH